MLLLSSSSEDLHDPDKEVNDIEINIKSAVNGIVIGLFLLLAPPEVKTDVETKDNGSDK